MTVLAEGRGLRLLQKSLFLVWLLSLPVLGKLYVGLNPSPDQSIFDYIAWLNQNGHSPYSESFEVNWPGAIILHDVAQWLFPEKSWAWRAFDYLLLQLLTLGFAFFLKNAGFRLAPFAVLAIYPPLYITSGYWMAGQRDIIAAGFIIVACSMLLVRGYGSRAGPVFAGVLLGFATLIRPTYVAFLAGAVLLELIHPRAFDQHTGQRFKRAVSLLAGAALLFACYAIIALKSGNLDDWFQQAIQFSLTSYQSDSPPLPLARTIIALLIRSWHWMTLLAGLGLLALIWRQRTGHALPLLLGLIATIFLSFYVQNKGFGYHLGGLLPCYAVLIAILVDALVTRAAQAENRHQLMLASAAVLAVGGIIAAGTGRKLLAQTEIPNNDISQVRMKEEDYGGCLTTAAAEQIAATIKSHTNSDDRTLILSCQVQVAYLARRLPSSRFGTSTAFLSIRNDLPLSQAWLSEFSADLHRYPPAYVLMTANHIVRAGPPITIDKGASPAFTIAANFMGDRYAPVASVGEAMLYRRR